MNIGIVIGLIKALAPGVDPEIIEQAVMDWLDDHPEATTTVQDGSITEAKLAQDVLADLGEIDELKEAIEPLEPEAVAGDVGKYMKVKSVSNGKVTEYEFDNPAVDPEDVAEAVDGWLDEHPEATTTVQDGSISKAKLASDVTGWIGGLDNQINGASVTPTVETVNDLNIANNGTAYATYSGRNTKYFPIVSGLVYTISVTATSSEKGSRLAVSSSVPANGVAATFIESKTGTYEYSYTAAANGYFSVSYYGSDITSVSASGDSGGGLVGDIEDLEDSIDENVAVLNEGLYKIAHADGMLSSVSANVAPIDEFTTLKVVNDGKEISHASLCCSGFVGIGNGKTYRIYAPYNYSVWGCVYDAGKRFLCNFGNETDNSYVTVSGSRGNIAILVKSSTAKYIRVNCDEHQSHKMVYIGASYPINDTYIAYVPGKLLSDDLDKVIDSKINGDSVAQSEFISGYVDSNGGYNPGGSNSNIVSKMINNDRFDSITVFCDTGYQFNICTFNGETFVARSEWYDALDGKIKIGKTYNVRVNVATVASDTSESLATVFSHIHIGLNGQDIGTIFRNLEYGGFYGLPFVQKYICSDTGGKIIHYSIDDVWQCMKDITTGSYESIFENTYFAAMKSLHETYGCCFTLNCFNTNTTDSDYSISNLPSTYQSELQGCKSWLRFAFHAEDDEANYDSSTGILTAYNTFVSAIYTLTGDYGCIDTMPRLGFFGGNLENVLSIKNADHGIIGLLCADNTSRRSYYLDSVQNEIVQTKGKYLDAVNELIHLKTITRTVANMVSEIEGNLCYQKYVEVFIHEPESISGFTAVAAWAADNGYSNAFPCDIFK